jgi:6-phosphogluconolactonase
MAPELWNRMTLIRMGRAAKASVVSMAMVLGISACNSDYTVAYLYMTTAKTLPHGLINGYKVDYQTGVLVALEDSPIDAGGRNTVALVAAPNNLYIYTVNHDDSDVLELAIGTDGKLYPENTYNVTGSFPTAAAIDPCGKFLYVAFTYQNGPNNTQLYTPANPGPGGITIFPINPASTAPNAPTENSLGTPTTFNVGRNPVGIVTSIAGGSGNCSSSTAAHFVYVIEQDSATTSNLLGFSANESTGALTALPGVTINGGNVVSTGFASGTSPDGILEDPAGAHLYVTDSALNQVATYSIASSGVPTLAGTAATGGAPAGMAFDPLGKYLYVVNYGSNSVYGYTLASGLPVQFSNTATGVGPTCVNTVSSPSGTPSHAAYLFTSNALSNNVTGEQLLEPNGTLEQIQGNPFGGSTLPTCLVSVPALNVP